MEVRLRFILKPLAKPIVAIFQKTQAFSSKGIKIVSLYFLLATSCIFVMLVRYPYSHNLKLLAIIFLFLSAFWDEVEREFNRTKGYSDILVFTALFYYLCNETFLEKFLPLRYLIVTWILLMLGILILPSFSERGGFDYKSERNLLLFLFAVAGYTHKAFSEYLCYGFAALTIAIYLSLLHSFLIFKGISLKNMIRSIPRPHLKLPEIKLSSISTREKEHEEEYEEYEELPKYNYTVIVTGEDGSPLPNVKVEVIGSNQYVTKLTNASGKCEFSLFEGEYKIKIKPQGFVGVEEERYISADSGEVFRLSRPRDLNVLVMDAETNLPLPNAMVTLSLKGEHHRQGTDNIGIAYFTNLKAEDYRLRVEARGYQIFERKVNPIEGHISVRLKKFPEKISNILLSPCLIEFSRGLENVLLQVTRAYLEEGKNVVLASSPPATAFYERNLSRVRIINIPTKGEISEGLATIPISQLEYFDYVIESLNENSILIFEPFSKIILTKGFEEALGFLDKLINKAGDKLLLCLNLASVEEPEKMEIEKRFKSIFVIEKEKLSRKK